MSNEPRDQLHLLRHELIPAGDAYCELDTEGCCITCSDEALEARVLRIDQEAGLALVTIKGTSEEIDITLLEGVAPGDVLLVHGGVAISPLEKSSDE
jgi:hydrogenase maturation factor